MNEGYECFKVDRITQHQFEDFISSTGNIDAYMFEERMVSSMDIPTFGENSRMSIYQPISIHNLTKGVVYCGSGLTNSVSALLAGTRQSILGYTDGIVICVEDITGRTPDGSLRQCSYDVPLQRFSDLSDYKVGIRVFHIKPEALLKLQRIVIMELGLSFALNRDDIVIINLRNVDGYYDHQTKQYLHQFSENGAFGFRALWPKNDSSPDKLYTSMNGTVITVPIIKDFNVKVPAISYQYLNDFGAREQGYVELPVDKLSIGAQIYIKNISFNISDTKHTIENMTRTANQELAQCRQDNSLLKETVGLKDTEIKQLKMRVQAYEDFKNDIDRSAATQLRVTDHAVKVREQDVKFDELRFKQQEKQMNLLSIIGKTVIGLFAIIPSVIKFIQFVSAAKTS